MKIVSVIGAAGHVGLGLSLVLANSGHKVIGIDNNDESNKKIMNGELPFIEEGAEPLLRKALQTKTLIMATDISLVNQSNVIIVVIGTPIDENQNPVIKPLLLLADEISPYLCKKQLIILRSTVSPGTTELLKNRIEKNTGFLVGRDIYLVFAPERVTQGNAINEIVKLPQLIGAFDEKSLIIASSFFGTFVKNKCVPLTPLEAELGKLITNVTRYLQFALVNEYYIICDSFGVNTHKIVDACNYDYPRLSLPTPGPNVGGPCLHKDGFFLSETLHFPELIYTALKINQGMPSYIVKKIKSFEFIQKVAILGMTFKADNDDTRDSLSFKLKKQLENSGYQPVLVDPYLKEYDNMNQLCKSDCVVLMTPHSQFKDLKALLRKIDNEDCLMIDIWGFWDEMRGKSRNGLFLAKEVKE